MSPRTLKFLTFNILLYIKYESKVTQNKYFHSFFIPGTLKGTFETGFQYKIVLSIHKLDFVVKKMVRNVCIKAFTHNL